MGAAADKLVPNDPRVKTGQTIVRGKTYSYMLGEPTNVKTPRHTIVLVHGFPDLGFGWRCQVPFLMGQGFRVLVPDMLGYGGTDAPEEVEAYSLKSLSDDVAHLARQFVGEKGQIVLGGHDWGGALVWRVAMWHPELIAAVFSVCTPYSAPKSKNFSVQAMVSSGVVPQFAYQLQLMGPEVQQHIQGREKLRQFLNAMYGGHGPEGEVGFEPTKGVLFDNLPILRKTTLLSDEELDYYTQQYMLHDAPEMRGPLNWYRSRDATFEEELPLANKEGGVRLEMPALMVTASRDSALPPSMTAGMERHFAKLSRGSVESTHWALTHVPDEVNAILKKWLGEIVNGGLKASL